MGVLSGVSDCAVTVTGGDSAPLYVGRCLKSKNTKDIKADPLSVISNPSDVIENTMKRIASTFVLPYGDT